MDRRFYIHEYSFSRLISDFPGTRAAALQGLAAAVAARVVRHHSSDGGEELGLVDEGAFSARVKAVDADARQLLGTLLSIWSAHRMNQVASGIQRAFSGEQLVEDISGRLRLAPRGDLVGSTESKLVASCLESAS